MANVEAIPLEYPVDSKGQERKRKRLSTDQRRVSKRRKLTTEVADRVTIPPDAFSRKARWFYLEISLLGLRASLVRV